MALVNCPDCGTQVSDQAPACPRCGRPIAQGPPVPPPGQGPPLVACPKCGSTQVSAGDKGFSLGKAAVGGVLTGGVGLLAGVHGSKRVRVNCLNCGFTWIPAEEAKKAKARKGLSKPVKIFLLFLIAMICVAVYLGKQDDRPAPQTPALPPPPAIVRTTIDDAIAKTGEYLNKAVVFEAPIDTILPAKDEDGNTMIVLAGAEAVAVCTEPGADKFAHLTKGDTVVVSAVHGGVLPTSQNGSIVLNKCVLNKK